MSAFQRIGWGPAPNGIHDNGIDLFVESRDARGFPTGLIAVQVKCGPSFFAEPVKGEEAGWWFRDRGRTHVDAWLAYPVPVVVVLVDEDTRQCYWEHVTKDLVIDTGKGAKIRVPANQTVDAQGLVDLEIAATPGGASPNWSGSAWRTDDVFPADRWRYALVVPRVIAPHPNAGSSVSISPAQGAALLLQARLREFDVFAAEHAEVPAREDLLTDTDWSWRFVGALAQLLTHDRDDALTKVQRQCPDGAARAAATAALASALLERQRADEALAVVDAALAEDDMGAADHAWVLAHRARIRAETGAVEGARSDSLEVVRARAAAPSDVTVAAFVAAATQLLFRTSMGGQALEDSIIASDSPATWWRAQTMAWGLNGVLDREWRQWAPREGWFSWSTDTANNQLVAALLSASHAADQPSTNAAASRLARDGLMRLDRFAPPERVAEKLRALIGSGDDKAVDRAVRHIVDDGPCAAIPLVAAKLELRSATRTTIGAQLKFLKAGGVALGEEAAAWAGELVALYDDPDALAARTSVSASELQVDIVEALAPICALLDPESAALVAARVLDLREFDGNQILPRAWAEVCGNLVPDAWSGLADRMVAASGSKAPPLDGAVLAAATRAGGVEARTKLSALAADGSVEALNGLGPVDAIERDLLVLWGGRIAEELERELSMPAGVSKARTSALRDLVVISAQLDEGAHWEVVVRALTSPRMDARSKGMALTLLSDRVDVLDEDTRLALAEVALALGREDIDSAPVEGLGGHTEMSVVPQSLQFAVAAGALDSMIALGSITARMSGPVSERTAATRCFGYFDSAAPVEGVLATLVHDRAPAVRAAAAGALCRLARNVQLGMVGAEALLVSAHDPGLLVPKTIASFVPGIPGALESELRRVLGAHESQLVRTIIQRNT